MGTNRDTTKLTRRGALLGLGATFAALPLSRLLGACGGDDDSDDATTERVADGGATPVDASASSDASSDAGTSADGSTLGAKWATGGTAAMLAKASYPDPFSGASGTSCKIACETTIGPCHTTSPARADVSDGWDGLPMRMSFRVVDESCAPIAGAIVEIWCTNYKGIYSGNINTMCNEAASDRAAQYFRGYQTTDANGRVDFDSCFPGWYSSRAVHVHLRVLKGSYVASDSADAWVITQLLFDDALIQEIFAGEPLYKTFGQPDTLLASDNVVGGETDKTPYLFDVTRMSDGVMQASKTLVLSTTSASCSAQGASGGGGGGPPGGGR